MRGLQVDQEGQGERDDGGQPPQDPGAPGDIGGPGLADQADHDDGAQRSEDPHDLVAAPECCVASEQEHQGQDREPPLGRGPPGLAPPRSHGIQYPTRSGAEPPR